MDRETGYAGSRPACWEEGFKVPRPKKDHILLNMRVDRAVMERFNAYCEEAGQTKTLAFERIVTEFLDRHEKERQLLEELRKNMTPPG